MSVNTSSFARAIVTARVALTAAIFAACWASGFADAPSVRGHVADAVGNPVVGAVVTCFVTNGDLMTSLAGNSDAAGDFDIPDTLPGALVQGMCNIDAPGYAVTGSNILFDSLNKFTLTPPSRISGTVVDQSGKPIDGVTVSVSDVKDRGEVSPSYIDYPPFKQAAPKPAFRGSICGIHLASASSCRSKAAALTHGS